MSIPNAFFFLEDIRGRWKGNIENQVLSGYLVLKERNILKSTPSHLKPTTTRPQILNPAYCRKEGIFSKKDYWQHKHRKENWNFGVKMGDHKGFQSWQWIELGLQYKKRKQRIALSICITFHTWWKSKGDKTLKKESQFL